MATTAKWPAALAALVDFGADVADIKTAVLSGSHNASVTTITLVSTAPAEWPTAGWVVIDTEIISYTGKSTNTLTGCTRGTQTTYGAGIAATHNDQSIVAPHLTAQQVNQVFAEIIALEKWEGNATPVATIASSGTTDLSTLTSRYAQVTGTTTITAFGTVNFTRLVILEFAGILTLTHNATSLILRSGANATTAAGDVYAFVSEGSGNWREIWHNVASVTAGMTQISKQTLGSASATITFSSIPGTYTNLLLILQGRGDTAATSVVVGMQFNADTGANYDDVRPAVNNTTWLFGEDVAATSINIMNMAAANSAANAADQVRIDIANYAGTTFQKSCTAQGSLKLAASSTNIEMTVRAGYWRSTAAITQIVLTTAAGNFITGTTATLYGLS